MALSVFISLLVLEAAVSAVGQPGFISIDCGLEGEDNYMDSPTGINYVSDGVYVETGENHKVTAVYRNFWGQSYRTLKTVRSFPSGGRNCYTLPTDTGEEYLVRLEFLYGNYDGKDSSLLKFNITLGVNDWETVDIHSTDPYSNEGYTMHEAVFVAWASYTMVCLVDIGQGTPFVSTVELRQLGSMHYPMIMGNQPISMYQRMNLGALVYGIIRTCGDTNTVGKAFILVGRAYQESHRALQKDPLYCDSGVASAGGGVRVARPVPAVGGLTHPLLGPSYPLVKGGSAYPLDGLAHQSIKDKEMSWILHSPLVYVPHASTELKINSRSLACIPYSGTRKYPDDQYDRYWFAQQTADVVKQDNISTQSTIDPGDLFVVPSAVLQTAFVPAGNDTKLVYPMPDEVLLRDHFIILHFADFQNRSSREFTVYVDSGAQIGPFSAPYQKGFSVTTNWSSNTEGGGNFTLAATARSTLPPILNAYEVYRRISHDNPTTFSEDFDAIMAIKYEYGIRKNWMGDPCFPPEFLWSGVECSNPRDKTMRIISLDLSNSGLHGSISNKFILLTALKYLNLSCNQLNGTIPDSLLKNNRSIVISYESDRDMCKKPVTLSPSSKRVTTIAVSAVAPVLVVAILVLAYLIWRAKRKHNVSANDPSMVPELMGTPRHRTNHWDHLQKN
uniref:Malectin-like domain-containing protein n=1 Tax=Oryza brachyantha TaxID=4533 RepID=J3MWR8_ORYBR